MREKQIFNNVAEVDIDRILNKKIRTPDMVFYKQLYCYAMRRKFDLKLETIATTLVPHDVNKRGMVHHSVVMHSIRKMDKLLVMKDHKYLDRAKQILNKIDTYEQN
jgi:chromosomal replication initiation ATPase DnaA